MANDLLGGIVGEVMSDPNAQSEIAKFLGLDKLSAQIKQIQDMQLKQNELLNNLAALLKAKK